MPEPKQEIFSDLDMSFTAHPITGFLSRKTNRLAVRQSVKNLILTETYERPYKPLLGCGIRNYLFEPFTPITRKLMEDSIRETIDNYEPRANLIAVQVEEYEETHTLTVSIAFMIQNDPEPVVLDVILERVR
jgi:phage baseplate assembly protein W